VGKDELMLMCRVLFCAKKEKFLAASSCVRAFNMFSLFSWHAEKLVFIFVFIFFFWMQLARAPFDGFSVVQAKGQRSCWM